MGKSTLLLVFALIAASGCQTISNITSARTGVADGLAYEISGTQGPLVVLIHGSNLDRRMWSREIHWLREYARVLRYDLRGQGESDKPVEPYSNHADLLGLLDTLGEDSATLIGLSSGAQVAIDTALKAPGRVRRLVLVSPSLRGYQPEAIPPYMADLSRALKAGDFSRANEILLASPVMAVPPARTGEVRTMVEDNTRLWKIPYSLVQQATPPAIERLDAVRIPALILVGENDAAAIRAQGELLGKRLPDGKRIRIDDGGHLLNMTSPEEFRAAVSGFLDWPREHR